MLTCQIFFQLWAPQKNPPAENVGNQFSSLLAVEDFSFTLVLGPSCVLILARFSSVPHAFQVLVSYTARTFSSRSDLAIEYPQACSCSTVSNIAMRVSYLCWRRHRIVLPLGIDCV